VQFGVVLRSSACTLCCRPKSFEPPRYSPMKHGGNDEVGRRVLTGHGKSAVSPGVRRVRLRVRDGWCDVSWLPVGIDWSVQTNCDCRGCLFLRRQRSRRRRPVFLLLDQTEHVLRLKARTRGPREQLLDFIAGPPWHRLSHRLMPWIASSHSPVGLKRTAWRRERSRRPRTADRLWAESRGRSGVPTTRPADAGRELECTTQRS
jgi:hypothetical protein